MIAFTTFIVARTVALIAFAATFAVYFVKKDKKVKNMSNFYLTHIFHFFIDIHDIIYSSRYYMDFIHILSEFCLLL